MADKYEDVVQPDLTNPDRSVGPPTAVTSDKFMDAVAKFEDSNDWDAARRARIAEEGNDSKPRHIGRKVVGSLVGLALVGGLGTAIANKQDQMDHKSDRQIAPLVHKVDQQRILNTGINAQGKLEYFYPAKQK